jgi:hypothetical protein
MSGSKLSRSPSLNNGFDMCPCLPLAKLLPFCHAYASARLTGHSGTVHIDLVDARRRGLLLLAGLGIAGTAVHRQALPLG